MEDRSSFTLMDEQGEIRTVYVRDDEARNRIQSMYDEVDDIIKSLGDITPSEPTEPTEPDDDSFKTAEEAIAALDSDWDTDKIWDTIARSEKAINADPSAFEKYIGMELTITHSQYGSHNVRVAGVAHDDKADGSGKAAFTFDNVDISFLGKMSESDRSIDVASKMPLWGSLQSSYFDGLPEAVRDAIVIVNKPCATVGVGAVTNAPCKVFFASEMEVFGTHARATEGTRYRYFTDNPTAEARLKDYNGNKQNWWLRTPFDGNTYSMISASNGALSEIGTRFNTGVSPMFCVGANKDVSASVSRLNGIWGAEGTWQVMHEVADDVRANPNAFRVFIGKTLTINHESYGSHDVRVIGICHDDKADGSGKAAFTFDNVDVLANMPWYPATNSSSGGASKMPLWGSLQGDYVNGLPDAVRNVIAEVSKPCATAYGGVGANVSCKAFALSEVEVFGKNNYATEGMQYDYWAAHDNNNFRLKKYNNSNYNPWWLRTPASSSGFVDVSGSGSKDSKEASYNSGVSPAFCID